ncbi:hypothetical protein ACFY1B_10035 [Streptomyces mirabilis]|uniref:hypothetical protein n=1 Tax=Streptomyces mirabilis TaxID=68239 RepID=UPI0036AC85E4
MTADTYTSVLQQFEEAYAEASLALSLWRSKVLATQLPAMILDGVLQEDAEAAVAALRDVGAQAESRAQPEPKFLKS